MGGVSASVTSPNPQEGATGGASPGPLMGLLGLLGLLGFTVLALLELARLYWAG